MLSTHRASANGAGELGDEVLFHRYLRSVNALKADGGWAGSHQRAAHSRFHHLCRRLRASTRQCRRCRKASRTKSWRAPLHHRYGSAGLSVLCPALPWREYRRRFACVGTDVSVQRRLKQPWRHFVAHRMGFGPPARRRRPNASGSPPVHRPDPEIRVPVSASLFRKLFGGDRRKNFTHSGKLRPDQNVSAFHR